MLCPTLENSWHFHDTRQFQSESILQLSQKGADQKRRRTEEGRRQHCSRGKPPGKDVRWLGAADEKRRTKSSPFVRHYLAVTTSNLLRLRDFITNTSREEALQQLMRKGTKSCLECEVNLSNLILTPRKADRPRSHQAGDEKFAVSETMRTPYVMAAVPVICHVLLRAETLELSRLGCRLRTGSASLSIQCMT